jgi:hypothetical protein
LREVNALYVAARRKGIQTRRFKLSSAQFVVVAQGLYDRKVEFIAAGNVYYTRRDELTWLLKAAEKTGIRLAHSTINKSAISIMCSQKKLATVWRVPWNLASPC